MTGTDDRERFEKLLEYLNHARGFDFTGYKRPTLIRRIIKRMHEVDVHDFIDYVDFLEVHPEEFAQVFDTVLINVTSFYRDPEAWDFLARETLPALLERKGANESLRIWSAGCSSGEEPFTLAMVLCELLGAETFRQRVKIYATDVDEDALAQARHGVYTSHAIEAIPAALRDKYFQSSGIRFAFNPELRRSVIFGHHDVVTHAPISRLDLLVCRNTLMYFNAETQARILARFHFALVEKGSLFLGRAELLLTHVNLFQPVELAHRIFVKVRSPNSRNGQLVAVAPSSALREAGAHRTETSPRLSDLAFDGTSSPRVIIDARGILAVANRQARSTFGIRPADIGRAFSELELSYRPVELRSLIDEAISTKRHVSTSNVEWRLAESERHYLDVHVTPIFEAGGTVAGVVVAFIDISRFTRLQGELKTFNIRLETAYEELQSTNEELETTNEELQSTVEELETTNEELQSANEELETMNEELQSSSEELQTLNDELHLRTSGLDEVNRFLESILAALHAAVVVLDSNFLIKIWTRKAEDMWGLRADEVRQQSFFSLDFGLPTTALRDMINTCMENKKPQPELAVEATNRRGKRILCGVTCTPNPGPNETTGAVLMMEEKALQ